MSGPLRLSHDADVPELVELLALGFADDPVVQHFLRQDHRHHDAERRFFRLAVTRMSLPFGEVRQVGTVATALWVPPGCWRLGLREQLELFPQTVRITGRRRLLPALRGLAAMNRLHPPEPHMYLSFLCTHPDHQRRGHGGRLLADMTARCDQAELPIYLENTKPNNEAFYRHFGFEVVHDIPLPPDGPRYYTGMWRRPRDIPRRAG